MAPPCQTQRCYSERSAYAGALRLIGTSSSCERDVLYPALELVERDTGLVVLELRDELERRVVLLARRHLEVLALTTYERETRCCRGRRNDGEDSARTRRCELQTLRSAHSLRVQPKASALIRSLLGVEHPGEAPPG